MSEVLVGAIRADATGKLEGAIAQYEDTPEAQRNAELLAIQREKEELFRRNEERAQEELGKAKH